MIGSFANLTPNAGAVIAVVLLVLVVGLMLASRGLLALGLLRDLGSDFTRKQVFVGPFAEGREAMQAFEAADVPCELHPLDSHGEVEITVRAKDLSKARAALADH